MTNTYEVLLQRENGLNKTVYVHDCMYEDEARLEAESTYGLPVLRVLFRGQTNSWNSNTQADNSVPRVTGTGLDLGGVQGIFGLLIGGGMLLLLVEFWYLFVIGGVSWVGWTLYKESK